MCRGRRLGCGSAPTTTTRGTGGGFEERNVAVVVRPRAALFGIVAWADAVALLRDVGFGGRVRGDVGTPTRLPLDDGECFVLFPAKVRAQSIRLPETEIYRRVSFVSSQ